LARSHNMIVTPGQVSEALDISRKTSIRLLQGLVEKGKFRAEGGTERIRSYRLLK
jgi:predicted HTH transcriptional regulator